MKERILTALVLIALFAGAMALGNTVLFTFIAILIVLGSYEIYRLNKDTLKPFMMGIYMGLTICGGLMSIEHFPIFVSLALMLLFMCVVFFEWYTFNHAATAFIMIMMLVLAIHAVGNVILNYGILVFIYVLLATYLTDTFAYFGGMAFGKHKLIERISPKKTIEGAIIGYTVSAILSFLFGYFMLVPMIPVHVIVVGSLVIPFIGQIGDLAFSSIKRQLNVKDFGVIFPGHGGVLDRIDSVIFAFLTFNIILTLFL